MSSTHTGFSCYASVAPFITKDGSTIRELMHPNQHGNRKQSLAEATVPTGGSTYYHYHQTSDEIYHITEGEGVVVRNGERVNVVKGDTVWIPAGVHHNVENTGTGEMRFLCALAPPYSHEDTFLVDKN